MPQRNKTRQEIGDTQTPTVRGLTNIRHNAYGRDSSAGHEYEILSSVFQDVGRIAQLRAEQKGLDMMKEAKADVVKGKSPQHTDNHKYEDQYMKSKGEADVITFEKELQEWRADPENAKKGPEDFKEFAKLRRKAWLSNHDSDAYAIGFSDALNVEAQMKSHMVQEKIQTTRANHVGDVVQAFTRAAKQTLSTDSGSDLKNLRKLISLNQQELAESENLSKSESNFLMLQALKEIAIKEEDPSILDVFSLEDDSGQRPWLGDPSKLRQARQEINNVLDAKENEELEALRQKKAKVLTEISELTMKGEYVKALEVGQANPGAVSYGLAVNLKDAAAGGSTDGEVDKEVERDIIARVARNDWQKHGYTIDTLEKLFVNGKISKETWKDASKSLSAKGVENTALSEAEDRLEARLFHLADIGTYNKEQSAFAIDATWKLKKSLQEEAVEEFQYKVYALDKDDMTSYEYRQKISEIANEVESKFNDRVLNQEKQPGLTMNDEDPNKRYFLAQPGAKILQNLHAFDGELDAETLQRFGAETGMVNATPAEVVEQVKKWRKEFYSRPPVAPTIQTSHDQTVPELPVKQQEVTDNQSPEQEPSVKQEVTDTQAPKTPKEHWEEFKNIFFGSKEK